VVSTALRSIDETTTLDLSAIESLFSEALDLLAGDLERCPASLLHGDLGDREVIVDPGLLRVTGIVDWGDALVGDPLYEFARFVAGGPPGDLRPKRFVPVLRACYESIEGASDANPSVRRLRALYDAHNALRNAAWSGREEPTWVPGLLEEATRCLLRIESL
jgi:aminoglycoside phosphotransferase (APT) family kinase protein